MTMTTPPITIVGASLVVTRIANPPTATHYDEFARTLAEALATRSARNERLKAASQRKSAATLAGATRRQYLDQDLYSRLDGLMSEKSVLLAVI